MHSALSELHIPPKCGKTLCQFDQLVPEITSNFDLVLALELYSG